MGRPLASAALDTDKNAARPSDAASTASAASGSAAASSSSSTQPHVRGYGAGADTGAGVTRPKTQEELEADARYDELMEEEYAKRDGGA
ncbi:hypothetical protein BROUX41_003513 [Berkeleyomyces rouxiae]|uniref:uncharacterized protein n=1 Tax=Berkeleyomyces rouxiae TaxID=2035830 RepID=UPI003B76BE40